MQNSVHAGTVLKEWISIFDEPTNDVPIPEMSDSAHTGGSVSGRDEPDGAVDRAGGDRGAALPGRLA